MKRFYLFSALLILTIIGYAHTQAYQKIEAGIQCNIDSINIEIQYFNPNIVRVVKSPIYISVDKKSLSVIKIPEKTV